MKLNLFARLFTLVSILTLIGGCAGKTGMTSQPSLAVPIPQEDGELNALIRDMAASVSNGQIASRLAADDRQFRLQHLASAVRSHAFQQEQRWSHPNSGNAFILKPLGQQIVDPYTRQNCLALEEVLIPIQGRKIRENRRACQDLHSGQWNLVQ
ncbi:MAG: hypothetical protein PHE55_06685 [Methylococcaceae bacterium]|nr:hypothetical protein [Methylococcaceae bacterium]